MVEIIPALMPKTFGELRESIEKVAPFVEMIQLDIMDGIFVPEKSWPYSEDLETVESLLKDEQGLPLWEEVNYELDLMIRNPEETMRSWVSLCASRIIVHFEALDEPKETLRHLHDYLQGHRDKEGAPSLELGLALSLATSNDVLEELVSSVDFIQYMGIAKIGYQGQIFDDSVISKIEELHRAFPELPISVDGGVGKKNASALVAAGATRLVSGSFILTSPDISSAIDILKESANS